MQFLVATDTLQPVTNTLAVLHVLIISEPAPGPKYTQDRHKKKVSYLLISSFILINGHSVFFFLNASN